MSLLLFTPEISSVFGCPATKLTALGNRRRNNTRGCSYERNNISRVGGSIFRVFSSMMDCGVRVSDSMKGMDVSPNLSSSGPSSTLCSKQKEGDGDKQKYYVNLGYAIRTLREEFPNIFNRDLSYDIYRNDVVFKDPLNTFVGIDNYKFIMRALQFNGRVFFKALWIDIIGVWQPAENVIMVRWIVHGIPRVPWESYGRFDGTSEYKLDKNGKIFEHKVDNVALNSPPKFKVLPVEELIQAMGCPSTPRPTYFEILSSVLFLSRFTWVRCYMAINPALSWSWLLFII